MSGETSWTSGVKALLLDITGVLYNSGPAGGIPIEGSAEAINKLRNEGIPFRLVTNETQSTRVALGKKLDGLGFQLSQADIYSPAPCVRQAITERGLRPHFLVHPKLTPEFDGLDTNEPNCVVIADAAEHFTYDKMNQAFQVLLKTPTLLSMGIGKYYREGDHLVMDVGGYTKALEYACDCKAEVFGKPAPSFFQAPLQDMGVSPENALMVGDDIVHDVGGAQACGIKGVLVRSGKYRATDENHPTVKPDSIQDNLAQVIDAIIASRKQ